MRIRSLLIPAAAALALAAPAWAHRQWLLPSTTTLADTDSYVTVDAAISNDLFYPDHFPMQLAQVKAWAPDGTPVQIENGATGKYRSTFDVRIDKPGTWKIGTDAMMTTGSFLLNGEEWRIGGRRGPGGPGMQRPAGAPPAGAPREGGEGRPGGAAPGHSVAGVADIPAGATNIRLTEVMNRNYVFVTAGAPTTTVFAPTGKGLELQPITHPTSLVSDEPAQFRFLLDGKPAAGVKVAVVPGSKKYRQAEGAQELTTGADGTIRVTWPVAGMYWISATATDAKSTTPNVAERRMSYTTTVEVPAP